MPIFDVHSLVHVSQLSDRYIRHPSEAVSLGDIVRVKVLSVDVARKRISLTMKLKAGEKDEARNIAL